MKKILLLCFCVMMSIVAFAEEAQKVAILEVLDRDGNIPYSQKLMIRSNLTRAISNTNGYEAFERADVDAILNEQGFQRTGNVSDSQIKRVGEMTGVAYILVSEGVRTDEGKVFLTAKIINVETAKVEVTDNILLENNSSSMLRGCRSLANKMFGVLAGISTTSNKFFSIFTKNSKQDSIAAAQKAKEAEIKEQQRMAEQKARQERAEAEEKARQDRAAAEMKIREQNRLQKEREAAELAERQKYFITKLDNKHYEYQGSIMDKAAYASFLQNNCSKAYMQYNKGKKLIGAGWGLFVPGLTLCAAGSACYILYDFMTNSQEEYLAIIGIAALSAGGTMTLISIPLLGAGYSKRNNAYKVYNEQCTSSKAKSMALNFTVGAGSIGLAYQF